MRENLEIVCQRFQNFVSVISLPETCRRVTGVVQELIVVGKRFFKVLKNVPKTGMMITIIRISVHLSTFKSWFLAKVRAGYRDDSAFILHLLSLEKRRM